MSERWKGCVGVSDRLLSRLQNDGQSYLRFPHSAHCGRFGSRNSDDSKQDEYTQLVLPEGALSQRWLHGKNYFQLKTECTLAEANIF